MEHLDVGLRIVHFLGLAMGFATSFANMMMGILIGRSAPEERPVLKRFLPMMGKLGMIGLALLWLSGVILLYRRYGGLEFAGVELYVKLAATVLLTIVVAAIHISERAASLGNTRASGRIPTMGKVAMLCALVALVFAVLAFQ